jgi:transcription termination factor NusB
MSHAKMPCTSQKLSQLQLFILLMGTYELDWQKLPMAMMISPKNNGHGL